MKFEYIREFILLAERCNYMESAEELFLSQASLSRHIKEMEKELGVPLFKRTTRKVVLTEYGLLFLPYAREVLEIQDKYTDALARQSARNQRSISIGAFTKKNDFGILDLIADFQKKYSTAHVLMKWNESDDLLKLLQNEMVDFVFVRELTSESTDGLIRIPIELDVLKVFLPKEHPLAQQSTVHVSQLKNETFFMTEDSSLTSRISMKVCHEAGFEPDIRLKGSKQQIFNMLNKGVGVSLLFNHNDIADEGNNVVSLDLEPNTGVYINMVYKKVNKFNSTQEQFLNYVLKLKV